jgi:hypothetical protein
MKVFGIRLPLLGVVLVLALQLFVPAAPLVDDVPEQHWARDALAALVQRGLVEGYPNGAFRGNRAASRWELAMVLARLVDSWDKEQAGFAAKQDLEALYGLVDALREELEALGARVDLLEQNATGLDRRVSELERISFYGQLEARFTGQSFHNTGQADNDGGRRGGGNPGTVPFLDYNSLVGSSAAAPLRPQTNALMPVVDYRNGRALSNGTGLTSLALLGLKLWVSEEVEAGMELTAYSSQGDRVVDAYWGVSAPYLNNPFTVNGSGGELLGAPSTKLTLDNFWVRHKPSKTSLRVGSLDRLSMDRLVYRGQPNLGVYGPVFWPGYGFRLDSQADLGAGSRLQGEIFGSRFGHGVVFPAAFSTAYSNYVVGADLAYEWNDSAGQVRLNWARIAEEQPNGQGLGVGLINNLNVPLGASSGWTPRQWVNPPGYFAAQRSVSEQASTGVLPNTADTRPIPGWSGTADSAVGVTPGGGNFGPQEQSTVGISGRYRWTLNERTSLRGTAKFATSDYRPSHNSSYRSTGQAWLVGLSGSLKGDCLQLGLDYLSVDPNYNPASWFGNVTGVRLVRPANFTGTFHLHDFASYPHNREGFRLNGSWKFDDNRGSLWARYADYHQKRTSLYDVRVNAGGLAPGTPTSTVIGFAPGFVDPIFLGMAHPLIYGAGTASSFNDRLEPFENPRGHERGYSLGGSYAWSEPRVTVKGSFENSDFSRLSQLSPELGGSQNLVNLGVDYANLEASWAPGPAWTVYAGTDWTKISGHLDPAGDYNAYAISIGSNNFTNLDSSQLSPYLGFEHKLSESTNWGLQQRYYQTTDHLGSEVRASRAFDQVGSTAHPFQWSGWQLSGSFSMKF